MGRDLATCESFSPWWHDVTCRTLVKAFGWTPSAVGAWLTDVEREANRQDTLHVIFHRGPEELIVDGLIGVAVHRHTGRALCNVRVVREIAWLLGRIREAGAHDVNGPSLAEHLLTLGISVRDVTEMQHEYDHGR